MQISVQEADATVATLPRAEHLVAELEEGNIEYKYKLTGLSQEQLAHRITQLNWRLNEGNNEAIYKIGVRDDGYPIGISDEDMNESLSTLRVMSRTLHCNMKVRNFFQGTYGKIAVIMFNRQESDVVAPMQLDVAVAGDENSGKSTLIGVLIHGELDNGKGLARTQIFKHHHELESGRTSSISHHLLFFGQGGQVLKSCTSSISLPNVVHPYLNQPKTSHLPTQIDGAPSSRIGADFASTAIGSSPSPAKSLLAHGGDTVKEPYTVGSTVCSWSQSHLSAPASDDAPDKTTPSCDSPMIPDVPVIPVKQYLVDIDSPDQRRLRAMSEEEMLRETLRSISFMDLAGNERYLKTTMHGMVGRAPQYCLLTVSAVANTGSRDIITPMTREHLALASVMKLRLILAVTKVDLIVDDVSFNGAFAAIAEVLHSCGMEGIVVNTTEDLSAFLEEERKALEASVGTKIYTFKRVPVFLVSNVLGTGLGLLKQYLFLMGEYTPNLLCDQLIKMAEVNRDEEDFTGDTEPIVLILDHFRFELEVAEENVSAPFLHQPFSLGDGGLSPCSALKNMNVLSKDAAENSTIAHLLETQGVAHEKRSNKRTAKVILFGSVQAGTISLGDMLLYGPNRSGHFSVVEIYSIHVNHVSLRCVSAGRCACFAIREIDEQRSCIGEHLETPRNYEDSAAESTAASPNLKIDIDVLPGSGSEDCTSVMRIRNELRIPHTNDPRRRKLRVDDPEHPSNLIKAPVTVDSDLCAKHDSNESLSSLQSDDTERPLNWPFRHGLVLLSRAMSPIACIEFEANILVLNHPKSIGVNYEPVVHCLGVRQCAKIISIRKLVGGLDAGNIEMIKNGEKAMCRFKFLYHPEYIPVGSNIVLREGRTRAIGIVLSVLNCATRASSGVE